MSNSSESDNVHYSDSEEVFKANRSKWKNRPNLRLIKDIGYGTKDYDQRKSVDGDDIGSDDIVQDGMMIAPPVVNMAEAENVPMLTEKFEEQITEEVEASPDPEEVFNRRALSKYSTTYELEKFQKNAMIIFNQESIEGYAKRLGTEKDVEALQSTFGRFHFDVVERKDLTKTQLFSELEEFSNTDFTDYGCVAVVVLTHGSDQGLLRAKDDKYSEIKLLNYFMNKPLLVTKPILFIIQACRGTKQTAGMAVHMAGRVRKDLDEEVEPYTLPVESDMLILHSSYVGKPSHRNEIHGSWFIQSLCEKIKELSDTHDFESILTEVKCEVAIDRYHKEYNRGTMEIHINKQMPVTTSTLIRKLYLRKYGEEVVYKKVENRRQSSRDEVLDSELPATPGPSGQCSCFLPHFDYIKECLRYFVEENPNDNTARGFLNVANTLKSERDFDATKEVMLRMICSHLDAHAQSYSFYKFLYFYKK